MDKLVQHVARHEVGFELAHRAALKDRRPECDFGVALGVFEGGGFGRQERCGGGEGGQTAQPSCAFRKYTPRIFGFEGPKFYPLLTECAF
jgi:hypothetical protein